MSSNLLWYTNVITGLCTLVYVIGLVHTATLSLLAYIRIFRCASMRLLPMHGKLHECTKSTQCMHALVTTVRYQVLTYTLRVTRKFY